MSLQCYSTGQEGLWRGRPPACLKQCQVVFASRLPAESGSMRGLLEWEMKSSCKNKKPSRGSGLFKFEVSLKVQGGRRREWKQPLWQRQRDVMKGFAWKQAKLEWGLCHAFRGGRVAAGLCGASHNSSRMDCHLRAGLSHPSS